jgi:hypothetical protein
MKGFNVSSFCCSANNSCRAASRTSGLGEGISVFSAGLSFFVLTSDKSSSISKTSSYSFSDLSTLLLFQVCLPTHQMTFHLLNLLQSVFFRLICFFAFLALLFFCCYIHRCCIRHYCCICCVQQRSRLIAFIAWYEQYYVCYILLRWLFSLFLCAGNMRLSVFYLA